MLPPLGLDIDYVPVPIKTQRPPARRTQSQDRQLSGDKGTEISPRIENFLAQPEPSDQAIYSRLHSRKRNLQRIKSIETITAMMQRAYLPTIKTPTIGGS